MHKIQMQNAVEAVYANGNATYTAAAAIVKGNPLKFSSAGKVTPCDASTDAAIGIALDDADEDDIVPVAILGCYTGTVPVRAAGLIAVGAQISAAGTTTGGATDVIIGRALEAAGTIGDIINVAHQVGQVL